MSAVEVARRMDQHNMALAVYGQAVWIDEVAALTPEMMRIMMEPGQINEIPGVMFHPRASNEKPDTVEQFEWMEPYVKTHIVDVEGKEFTAELITDNLRLWEEGRNMEHCIYWSYGKKVKSGNYCVYHISGPSLGKHGVTAGFSKGARGGWIDPQTRKASEIETYWAVDQVRGKKNNIVSCTNLDGFVGIILVYLNERLNGGKAK